MITECGITYSYVNPGPGWNELKVRQLIQGSTIEVSVWLIGGLKQCQTDLQKLCNIWSYHGEHYKPILPCLHKHYKILFDNDDVLMTTFNGDVKEARDYFLGKMLSFGYDDDNNDAITTAIAVDEV